MLSTTKNGTELFRFIQNKVKPERVVIIPDTIKTLSGYAFSNPDARGVKMVYLPDSITEIPPRCFWGSTVSFVRTSPKLRMIYEYAFERCDNLQQIYLPEECKLGIKRYDGTYINGDTVFRNCSALRRFSPWLEYHISDDKLTLLWQVGAVNGELQEADDKKGEFKTVSDKGYYITEKPKTAPKYYKVIERVEPKPRVKNGEMQRTRILEVLP